MKKLISILLVAVLLIGCMTMAVSAAESGKISVADKNATAGETVTVKFSINEITFQDYALKIKYDDALELTAIEAGSASHGTFGAKVESGKVAIFDMQEETKSGTLFTANFKVPAGAKVGDKYKVTVDNVNFVNQADEELDMSIEAGYITIVCPGHQWSEWYVTTPADCENPGEARRDCLCEGCDEYETKKIDALGHNPREEYESDDDYHWHICKDCDAVCGREKHVYDIEKDGYYWCKCGRKGGKVSGGGYDDEPENGDITGHITFAAVAVIMVLTTSAVLVFKRKTAK